MLFSLISMAAVAFHYAPITENVSSALLILWIGLLIAPVVFDPTNPMNIVVSIAVPLLIASSMWARKIHHHRTQRNVNAKRPLDILSDDAFYPSWCCKSMDAVEVDKGIDAENLDSRAFSYKRIQRDSNPLSDGECLSDDISTTSNHPVAATEEIELISMHKNARNNWNDNECVGDDKCDSKRIDSSLSSGSRSVGGLSSNVSSSGKIKQPKYMQYIGVTSEEGASSNVDLDDFASVSDDHDSKSRRNQGQQHLDNNNVGMYTVTAAPDNNFYSSECCPHQDSGWKAWMMQRFFLLKWLLAGFALASGGLLCFAFQSRQNYWFVHSLWHVLVMFSTFPFLLGRSQFFELANQLCRQ